jgi:hypothetical protein
MQDCAISMDSASSAVRVPSFRLEPRKSMMARARRFLLSVGAYESISGQLERSVYNTGMRVLTMMAVVYEERTE